MSWVSSQEAPVLSHLSAFIVHLYSAGKYGFYYNRAFSYIQAAFELTSQYNFMSDCYKQ